MNEVDQKIARLFVLRNKFNDSENKEKNILLNELSKNDKFSRKQVKKYLELLLFLLAYPANKTLYQISNSELNRIGTLLTHQKKLSAQLYQIGISQTRISGKFSFELIRWLTSRYKQQIFMDALEVEDSKIISVISLVMPEISNEILQEGQVKWKPWLLGFRQFKTETLLEILIRIFEASEFSPRIKEQLWSALEVYINFNLIEGIPNRSSLLSLNFSVYHHNEIKKQVSSKIILNQKVHEYALTDLEKDSLITSARMALACYQRETDPITFAHKKYSHYYQLSNGLSIALFGLPPQKRQTIDCYIGYLAYKNGLPIAYGGGWIFADSCRIGINIFPAFRGGESATIFMQILSAYKNIFNLNRFTVDPYQIGKNNTEGIHSAAFWMYYRLGFRPIQEVLKLLALTEYDNLIQHKNSRTSVATLKKLAHSVLEFCIHPKKQSINFDASDMSRMAQQNSVKQFASKVASKKNQVKTSAIYTWTENRFYENWELLIDWKLLDKAEQKYLLKIIKQLVNLKLSGDEWNYISMVQNAPKLLNTLMKQGNFSLQKK